MYFNPSHFRFHCLFNKALLTTLVVSFDTIGLSIGEETRIRTESCRQNWILTAARLLCTAYILFWHFFLYTSNKTYRNDNNVFKMYFTTHVFFLSIIIFLENRTNFNTTFLFSPPLSLSLPLSIIFCLVLLFILYPIERLFALRHICCFLFHPFLTGSLC